MPHCGKVEQRPRRPPARDRRRPREPSLALSETPGLTLPPRGLLIRLMFHSSDGLSILRRLHRLAGTLTVLCFLATGAYMRFGLRTTDLDVAHHLCYRSRHIYILAIGLVNLVLG